MLPRELDICITNACNMRCRYCYARGRSAGPAEGLAAADLERGVLLYLKRAAASGLLPEKVSVSGGEPLLRPAALASLAACFGALGRRGVQLEVFTNGLLLTPAAARRLASPNIQVKVSLDGPFAGRVAVSGGRPYARVLARLEALPAGLRSALGISATVTRSNSARFCANMRALLAAGAGKVGPSFAVGGGWTAGDYRRLSAQLVEFSAWLGAGRGAGRGAFAGFELARVRRTAASLRAFTLANEISLGPDGYFYPCSILSASAAAMPAGFNAYYRIGSLREGIDEARFGRLRAEAHREITAHRAGLYLGCLMCVYYMSKTDNSPLGAALDCCAELAARVQAAGLESREPRG